MYKGFIPSNTSLQNIQTEAEKERAAKAAANAQLQAGVAAGTLNPDGSPVRKEFQSLLDPSTGLLRSEYRMGATESLNPELIHYEQIDPSRMQGLQAFKGEALRTGPSKWAQLQQQALEQRKLDELGSAARQAQSAASAARSGMAMRGGLSSGSRERIAQQQQRNLLNARQGVSRQSGQSLIQLLSDDERNRLAMLGQLPGMETGIEQFNAGQRQNAGVFNAQQKYNTRLANLERQQRAQQFDIGSALLEQASKRGYDTDTYKEELKKWGGARQAEATERSGGGGGGGLTWICTKVDQVSPLSAQVKACLKIMRKRCFEILPTESQCYFYECGPLLAKMEDANINWRSLKWLPEKVAEMVEQKRVDEAIRFYMDAWLKLVELFWPDTENETLRRLINKNSDLRIGV